MKLVKCATPSLKKRGRFDTTHPVYKAATLFNGKIHFVKIIFPNLTVSDNDVWTAIKYATLASKPISQYCTQYGQNSVTVDQTLYSYEAPNSNFSDANLQSWVDLISTKYSFSHADAVAIMNPPGANNTDAPLSQGVLGYHGNTGQHPYLFVNMEGIGLTVDDKADVYADALSHEIAEMVVDPAADLSNPEVCDPCAGNCGVDYRNYFDTQGTYLGGSASPGYGFWTNGIATPGTVSSCPSPANACVYNPASPPAPGPGNLCIDTLQRGILEISRGNILGGIDDLVTGILCLFSSGNVADKKELRKIAARLGT